MKVAKLVIGIITIVLSAVILFQSCAAGVSNALTESSSSSGTAGGMLAVCYLVGGIVGIATRKSKGGTITAGCFYAIGGIIGIANVGTFKDLMIWSILSFIFAVVFIVSAILMPKKNTELPNDTAPKE